VTSASGIQDAELEAWKSVPDVKDENDVGYVTLTYATALKEFPGGLDINGCWVDVQRDPGPARYVDVPGLLVPFTVDMGWVYDHPRGKTVFVGDIKTGAHEIASGARNLQFVAPGLALAEREGAKWYRTGIYYAREARWEIGPAVHVGSALAAQDLQRLQRAGTNPPIPVIGGHCTECFQRAHCDAFNLPVSQAETALAPLTKPGGLEAATPEQLLQAHLLLSSLRKMEEVGSKSLKAEIARRGRIPLPDGKVLYLREQAGREYADSAIVKAKLPEAMKRGNPSQIIHVGKL